MKISEIFLKYETDKNWGLLKEGHEYGAFYDKLLNEFKDGIDILEIGVERGGSLLAWKEYFPNANVTGIDIIDMRKDEYISDKVNFILGNFRNVIHRIQDKRFDLIIDDGSHFLDDMIFTVKNYLQLLQPNGICVLEDVQFPMEWTMKILEVLPEGYTMDTEDLREINGRYDDFLIIIRKQ